MADVFIKINNQDYHLSCKKGEEDRLRELAEEVNEKVEMLAKQMLGTSNERLLLMAAIILADEKSEAGGDPFSESKRLKAELIELKTAFKEMKKTTKEKKDLPVLPSLKEIKNLDEELKGAVEQINNLARKLETHDDFPR